jgi:uncharacterized protein YjbI with pentapeptide repeats
MPKNNPSRSPVTYINTTIQNETIHIGTTASVEKLHGSTFTTCTFYIDASKTFMANRCQFLHCNFHAEQFDRALYDNYWDSCRFYGQFIGTAFGCSRDSEYGPSSWQHRALVNCDFSHALLNGCSFSRLDLDSTVLPEWPCFSILNPAKNTIAWNQAKFPFKIPLLDYIDLDGLDALVYYWPAFVTNYKIDATIDANDVRQVLSSLPFVRM